MKKPLWIICITHMFIEVCLYMQFALIPTLIREFEINVLEVSMVVTIPSLIQLLMNFPSGFLAQRYNTKRLLFSGMLIEGVSALMISQTSSFWMLVLGVSFIRIASAIYHVSALSQISLFAESKQVSKNVGFHNAFGNLGTAIGVLSLAIFLSAIGWRWTYLFWSVPILLWGLMILVSPQLKTEKFEKTEKRSRSGPMRLSLILSFNFLILLIAAGIREIGNTGSSTFMTSYFVDVRGLSESTASLVFGLGPFVGIVGSLNGGYLGGKIGAKNALSWIIFSCAISLFILSLVSQSYFLAFVYLVYSFFSNAAWSPMNALVTDLTSETHRGLGFSFYFFVEGAVTSITPTLAAGIILFSGVWYVFPCCAVFLLASMIVLQFLRSA